MNKNLLSSIICWIALLIGNISILFLDVPTIHAFFYMYIITFGCGFTGWYNYQTYKESKIKRWVK
jgi:hypothetical protein